MRLIFFNSTLLAKHVEQATPGMPSLFEVACRRGFVVPAFRDPKTNTLEEAYEHMKNVYGYGILHTQMQPYRDRVVASVDIGLQVAKPFTGLAAEIQWAKATAM